MRLYVPLEHPGDTGTCLWSLLTYTIPHTWTFNGPITRFFVVFEDSIHTSSTFLPLSNPSSGDIAKSISQTRKLGSGRLIDLLVIQLWANMMLKLGWVLGLQVQCFPCHLPHLSWSKSSLHLYSYFTPVLWQPCAPKSEGQSSVPKTPEKVPLQPDNKSASDHTYSSVLNWKMSQTISWVFLL